MASPTYIPDAWLAADKGDSNTQAICPSSSNRLAWAGYQDSDCRLLKSSKRGQGSICEYSFRPLPALGSPTFHWPEQVPQPNTDPESSKLQIQIQNSASLGESHSEGQTGEGGTWGYSCKQAKSGSGWREVHDVNEVQFINLFLFMVYFLRLSCLRTICPSQAHKYILLLCFFKN